MNGPEDRLPADRERQSRYRRGRSAEWLAVALLAAKGYRILARRHRTPYGEIDIVARRGRRLAFVEVKQRKTLAEAEWALTPYQEERIVRAAEHFMARRPRYAGHEMGLDLVLIVPWQRPRHLMNAFGWRGDGWRRRY
jgi:putative endonuclease